MDMPTMRFQKSSVIAICGLTVFVFLVLLHLEKVIDVSWSVIFIPLWFVYIAIAMVVWSMYDSFKKRKLMHNAKTVGTIGCFVLAALVATQIMIQVDLSYSDDYRDHIQIVDTDDNESLSRICSVKIEVLDYLFDNSLIYWKPSLNETRGLECGDRLISHEELYADFLSNLGCTIASVDPVSGRPVHLEIGDEYDRPIPVWWVISPLFFLLFVTAFVIIRSGGPSVTMIDGLGSHMGISELGVEDPEMGDLEGTGFDPADVDGDMIVDPPIIIEGGDNDPLFDTDTDEGRRSPDEEQSDVCV